MCCIFKSLLLSVLWIFRASVVCRENPNVQAFSSLGFSQQVDKEFVRGEDDGCVGDLSN